jgi:hypothetical protein
MGSGRKSVWPDCQVGTGWDIGLALTDHCQWSAEVTTYCWKGSTCIASFDGRSVESVVFGDADGWLFVWIRSVGCEALRLDVVRWRIARSKSSSTATTTLNANDFVEHMVQDHTCGSVLSPTSRGLSQDCSVKSTTNPQGVARNANQQAPFGIIDPPPPTIRHAALLDGISLRSSLHCINWDMMVMRQLRTNNRHGP